MNLKKKLNQLKKEYYLKEIIKLEKNLKNINFYTNFTYYLMNISEKGNDKVEIDSRDYTTNELNYIIYNLIINDIKITNLPLENILIIEW